MSTPFKPERSGVYRTPVDAAELRDSALAGGAAWTDLDLRAISDKLALLQYLARSLRFPAHFGANWDALADSLQDLQGIPHSGYMLRLFGAAQARRALGTDWATFLEILTETAM